MMVKCSGCLLCTEDVEDGDGYYCNLGSRVYDLCVENPQEIWQISFDCKLSEISYYDGICITKKPAYMGEINMTYKEESHGYFVAKEKPQMSKYYKDA